MNISSGRHVLHGTGRCRGSEDPQKPLTYPEALERAKAFLRGGKEHPYRRWTIYILDEDTWFRGSLNLQGYDQDRRDAFMERICDLANQEKGYRVARGKEVMFRLRVA